MPVRNLVSWTAMIVGYVNVGDLVSARKVFDTMPKRNQVSWNAMISGYAKFGQLNCARKLFDKLPTKNVVSYTTMIDGFVKTGDMASARMLFEECLQKDLVLWSALVSWYAQNGLPQEAVKSFREMQLSNIRPDEYKLVSIMSACAQLGNSELAKEIDSNMDRSSFDLQRTHVVAALVDMNAKCCNMERAMNLFNNMPKCDLVSYCSMIQGHALHGQGPHAVRLFCNILAEGLVPDDVAFTVTLTACSYAVLVQEGRSGQIESAYDLLRSLSVEAHAEAGGALLGACRLHCDTELAEVVAIQLVELEPYNAGNFVLLSNVYAAADRWLDVTIVRNQMVGWGLGKIPGRSWA